MKLIKVFFQLERESSIKKGLFIENFCINNVEIWNKNQFYKQTPTKQLKFSMTKREVFKHWSFNCDCKTIQSNLEETLRRNSPPRNCKTIQFLKHHKSQTFKWPISEDLQNEPNTIHFQIHPNQIDDIRNKSLHD